MVVLEPTICEDLDLHVAIFIIRFGVNCGKSWQFSACICVDEMVIILDYWSTSNLRKYKKYCLDLFQFLFMDNLDTLWYTHEISKDLV